MPSIRDARAARKAPTAKPSTHGAHAANPSHEDAHASASQGPGAPAPTDAPPAEAAATSAASTPKLAEDARSFVGRVVDPLDQAVRAARVQVWHDEAPLDFDPAATTTSAADGSFKLRVEGVGRYLLRVSHADFASGPNRRGLWAHDDGPTKVGTLTLASGRLLMGRCVDASTGRSLAGVEITLRPSLLIEREDHGLVYPRLRTKADGLFEFTGLAARRYTIEARPEGGFARHVLTGLRARLPDEEGVVLRLEPGHALRVRVRTHEKKPIAGAEIRLEAGARMRTPARVLRSSRAGVASFEQLAAGTWRLVTRHRALVLSREIELPRAEPLDVELPSGRKIDMLHSGAERGRPCRWRLVWQDARRTPRSDWIEAVVPRERTVRIEGLPSLGSRGAELGVELRVPGYAPAYLAGAELRSGASFPAVRAAQAKIRLRDPSRRRLSSHRVTLRSIGDDIRPWSASVRSNDRGVAVLEDLPHGAFRLEIDGHSTGKTIMLRAGRSDALEVRWPPRRGRLDVVLPKSLARGARLHVWSDGGRFRDLRAIDGSTRLSFPGILPGKYGVRLRAGDRSESSESPQFVEVVGGESVRLDLR